MQLHTRVRARARVRVGGKVQATITVTVTVAVMVMVPVTGIVKGMLMVTVMALCNTTCRENKTEETGLGFNERITCPYRNGPRLGSYWIWGVNCPGDG